MLRGGGVCEHFLSQKVPASSSINDRHSQIADKFASLKVLSYTQACVASTAFLFGCCLMSRLACCRFGETGSKVVKNDLSVYSCDLEVVTRLRSLKLRRRKYVISIKTKEPRNSEKCETRVDKDRCFLIFTPGFRVSSSALFNVLFCFYFGFVALFLFKKEFCSGFKLIQRPSLEKQNKENLSELHDHNSNNSFTSPR